MRITRAVDVFPARDVRGSSLAFALLEGKSGTLNPNARAMSLIDLVRQNLTSADVQQISGQLGADPSTTEQAIQAALPMMVGGMAGAAQQPGGESAIQGALGGLLGGGGGGLGGILGSILGQHQSTVQDGVTKASGLDAGKAGKLLILLAPFILRALAKHQGAQPAAPASTGAQPGGVGGILQKEAQDAMNASSSPHVGGVLGKILAGLS